MWRVRLMQGEDVVLPAVGNWLCYGGKFSFGNN